MYAKLFKSLGVTAGVFVTILPLLAGPVSELTGGAVAVVRNCANCCQGSSLKNCTGGANCTGTYYVCNAGAAGDCSVTGEVCNAGNANCNIQYEAFCNQ